MFVLRLPKARLRWYLAVLGGVCIGWNGNTQVLIEDQASGVVGEILTDTLLTPNAQLVQSFTPAFGGIGFVQLQTIVGALDPGNVGVTVVVQLREGGSLGPVIATTEPLFLQHLSNEFTTFLFSDNILIIPDVTYFFQPVVLSGGSLAVVEKIASTYTRGDLFVNGSPTGGRSDLWFREGLVAIPERSIVWLALLGAGGVWVGNRRRRGGGA